MIMFLRPLKPFILVYDTFELPRDEILDFLDTLANIKNYYAYLPTSIIIISDLSATELSDEFRGEFPGTEFIIIELQPEKINGWLDKGVWSFINNSQSSGRWAD